MIVQKWQTKFRSVFRDKKTRNEIQIRSKVMRKRKRKNEIHIRFSKWCENEKRKLKFISVFQRDAKTKYEVQNRFSKLVENEKQKAKFKSVFQCHAKTKNGNGTWIPFSHAIEKRLALRYTHLQVSRIRKRRKQGQWLRKCLNWVTVTICYGKRATRQVCRLFFLFIELHK